MGMGPNIQSVDRSSQATPFAEDFLKLLQGQLSTAFAPGAGTAGMTPGTNFQQALGGINTASQLTNAAPGLIEALTNRSQATTDRDAAQLRESFGAMGGRFGSAVSRGEGQLRSESGLNLDQLVASVLMEQSGREQAARQFDVMSNLEAAIPFFQMAGQGIIPQEIIASPGIGSQLLSGGLNALGMYLGGGGSFGLGNLFGGGGGNQPQGPMQFPNPGSGGNIWEQPQFGPPPGRNI